MAKANNEFCLSIFWIDSKYYCPILSFSGVTALNIKNDDIGDRVHTEPDTFGGLPYSLLSIQYFEISSEKSIEKRTFSWALWPNDGYDLILLCMKPMCLFGKVL